MPPPPAARGRPGTSRVGETTTYLAVPESRARRDQAARRDRRAGLRRHPRLGEGSRRHARRARAGDSRPRSLSLRRDTIAALLAAHDGTLRARLLPDVKDGGRASSITPSSCRAPISTRWCSTSIPRRIRIVEADLRRRRPGQSARRGAVLRLPAGRRRADRLLRRRCVAATTPCSSASVIELQDQRRARSRRLFKRPCRLERPSPAVVRRAVRRSVCRRARRASCGRSSPEIDVVGAGRPAVRGGRRPADRRLPRPRGHRPHRGDREDPEVAGDAAHSWSTRRAREPPDALVVIDFPGLQLSAGAPRPQARHPGRLLHQPADLGVAAGPAEDDPRDRRPRARDLSVRGSDLPRGGRAGGVRRPSAGRSRAAASAARQRFCAGSGLDPAAPTVAMLPGSRPNEVARILPDLRRARPA